MGCSAPNRIGRWSVHPAVSWSYQIPVGCKCLLATGVDQPGVPVAYIKVVVDGVDAFAIWAVRARASAGGARGRSVQRPLVVPSNRVARERKCRWDIVLACMCFRLKVDPIKAVVRRLRSCCGCCSGCCGCCRRSRLVLLEPEPPFHVVPEEVVRERDVLLLLVQHDAVMVAAPKSSDVPASILRVVGMRNRTSA